VDLELYLRVLWRFRLLVAVGFLLAVALSVLAVVRVNPLASPAFTYRENEEWVSRSMLLLTERGFPVGRSRFETEEEAQSSGRFADLAALYARLANGDEVRALMLKQGPIDDENEFIEAAAVLSNQWNSNSPPLPLVSISAFAPTPERAAELARRETAAFREYLARQQEANRIPDERRVLVSEINRSTPPELLKARSKTLPAVVFMTIALAVIGLAFLLENLRPRVRAPRAEATVAAFPDAARRSA
jgi:hypothetical protein